jgi:putative RecB family exonuclease
MEQMELGASEAGTKTAGTSPVFDDVRSAVEPEPRTATLSAALSPSRASDFMTCPLLYRFRSVDRIPERPSAAAARGTLVHAVLEELFDLPAAERTPERAVELLRPAWDRQLAKQPELADLFTEPTAVSDVTVAEVVDSTSAMAEPTATDASSDGSPVDGSSDGDAAIAADTTEEVDARLDFAAWLASAAELLRRYFTLEDPRRLEPAQREMFVQARITAGEDPLLLRGYVDRLDVAPNGAMRVVDYKTGRAPGPLFEAKALFQMRFYALVLSKLRGSVPRRLQLMNLGSGEVLRYEPDEADMRATERKVVALWAAIRRAAETGDWQPRPSKLCDYCDHKPRCPAHGGTPPSLPEVVIRPAGPGTRAEAPANTDVLF